MDDLNILSFILSCVAFSILLVESKKKTRLKKATNNLYFSGGIILGIILLIVLNITLNESQFDSLLKAFIILLVIIGVIYFFKELYLLKS